MEDIRTQIEEKLKNITEMIQKDVSRDKIELERKELDILLNEFLKDI